MTRYHPNGVLGSTLGNNDIVFTTMPIGDIYPEEIELDQNENIYLTGHINKSNGINDGFYLLRFHPNGKVDMGYAIHGIETILCANSDRVRDMIVQPDGKILVGGEYSFDYLNGIQFGIMVRYLPFPVSVKEINKDNNTLQLYPNPSVSKISVKG